MKTLYEPARETSVTKNVDVLVAGGGPAGVAAAVAAARQGAETLLVEQFGDVGGVSTIGMMSHWTGETRGGLYEEILERSARLEADMGGRSLPRSQTINPETLKSVYLDMLEEAGAALRFYTQTVAPIMIEPGAGSGRAVGGVIVESKSGREAFAARVVIDATGDGDIAARAGVPFRKGREKDGKMQPLTLMFKVAGVESGRAVLPGMFEANLDVPAGKIQDLAREHLPAPAGHCLLYPASLPGVVTCNMTNAVGVDGADADGLTRAQLACRRQIPPIVRFLRRFVPGFEKCYPIASASFIGIRETRHFEGEARLTEDDILAARVFPDWAVTNAHFGFDVHRLDGPGLDPTGCQRHFRQNRGYTIPYGALVPKNVDGLLLSGRNIAGTHLAHSSYRVMPICALTGQAAGSAAALCARRGCQPRRLPVEELQHALLAGGMLEPKEPAAKMEFAV